ncbi:MAG: AI-2E family transporter [Planctomycetota bacterium]
MADDQQAQTSEDAAPADASQNDVLADAPAWSRLHLWQMQPIRDVLLGLGVIGLFWLGHRVSIVTVPLLLAVLFAYLFEPVIKWVEAKTVRGRRPAVIVVMLGAILLVVLPSIGGATYGAAQLVGFVLDTADRTRLVYESVQSPDDEALAERVVDEAGQRWGGLRDWIVERGEEHTYDEAFEVVQRWLAANADQIAGATALAGRDAIGATLGGLATFAGIGFTIFLTLFFFFFVSTGWASVRQFGGSLVPDRHSELVTDLAVKFDRVVSGFVRGRLTIAFVQGVFFSLAYFAIGVPAAFVLGPAVAVLSIVPYLAIVGIPISIALLWFESYTGVRGTWWWAVFAPIVIYNIGQALDDYVLTPMIQGKQTGLDTPVILFATLAGGALFGFFGLLIAIPIAACVKILIQEVFWPRFREWAEGRSSDPLPID